MRETLQGKVVILTGATSGIGAATTARLLERGAVVAGIGRDREKLRAATDRGGGRFMAFSADLSSEDDRARCVAAPRSRFVRVDVLMNNAGEALFELPLACTLSQWRALLELNLLAAIDLTQVAAALMTRGGRIVNVSSVTARFLPSAPFSPYALTKAALEHFTEGLRLELSPRGLGVTLVRPGLVETPIYDSVRGFQEMRARIAREVPRWLDADDVAEAVVWILERPAHVVVSEVAMMPLGQGR